MREANTSEVKALKRENEELTHIFKEASLELRVLKKIILQKNRDEV